MGLCALWARWALGGHEHGGVPLLLLLEGLARASWGLRSPTPTRLDLTFLGAFGFRAFLGLLGLGTDVLGSLFYLRPETEMSLAALFGVFFPFCLARER